MQCNRRVQAYRLFSRGIKWLPGLPKPLSRISWILQSLWRAVWLGLLDTEALNYITWSYYMGTSGFEEEEFNIEQGLWPWEANAIKVHFKGEKHVLVAGAGGGREVIALAHWGFEVTAFDFSSHLTAACRRNLKKAGCVAHVLDAPAGQLPEGLGIYDALLIGRGFYHHIPGRVHRTTFLKDCCGVLKPGSPIILSDFFTRADGSKFYQRTEAVANAIRLLSGHSERVELGDWLSECIQHAFTREEIEQEILDAGMRPETFRNSSFSENSRLAYVLGRAS